jgi:hypothetical protein
MNRIVVDIRWVYPDNGEDIRVLEVKYGYNPFVSLITGELTYHKVTDWQQPKFIEIPTEEFQYWD